MDTPPATPPPPATPATPATPPTNDSPPIRLNLPSVGVFGVVCILAGVGISSLFANNEPPVVNVSVPTASAPAAATPPPAAAATCTDDAVVHRFHQLWYENHQTWEQNKWFGLQTSQNPMDVWIMEELIVETKPDYIIECGTWNGGSAALLALILSQANPAGRVLSIDIEDRTQEARKLSIVKEKVEFIAGSSTAPEVVAKITGRVKGKKVLVLLDSDHHKANVLKELQTYTPLVQVGGYVVVQDSNVNGNPVAGNFGPGPKEAMDEFLPTTNGNFIVDKARERLMFTFSPGGYLKRVK
jgi:cephalosporin hydroxylase